MQNFSGGGSTDSLWRALREADNLFQRFTTRTECAQHFIEAFPEGFDRQKQRARNLCWFGEKGHVSVR